MITITTWGLKHGPLPPHDVAISCLNLPNPHGRLPHGSGLDREIQDQLVWEIRELIRPMLETPIKHVLDAPDFTVLFYCHGGRHRSVAAAVALSRELAKRHVPHLLRIPFLG